MRTLMKIMNCIPLVISLVLLFTSDVFAQQSGTIQQGQLLSNNQSTVLTNFGGNTTGSYIVDLNIFTTCYGVTAKMKAIVSLDAQAIQVLEYNHFASKKTDDPVKAMRAEVSPTSEAYARYKLSISGNQLQLVQLSNACGAGQKLRVNESSWRIVDKENISIPTPKPVNDGNLEISNKRGATKEISTPQSNSNSDPEGYNCITERVDVEKAMQSSNVIASPDVVYKPMNSILYPGALVYAEDYLKGDYKAISTGRKPITVSVDAAIIDGSPAITIPNPSVASSANIAINDLLIKQKMGGLTPNQVFNMTSVYSEQQMDIALSGSFSRSGLSLSGSFQMETSTTKKVIIASYVQSYYTLSADQVRTPTDFFATVDDANRVINSGKTPLYVSSVTYGRIGYFLLETEADENFIMTEFKAAYDGVGQKAEASGKASLNNVLNESKIKVVLMGFDGKTSKKPISSFEEFKDAINHQEPLSKNTLAKPIAYTMRFLNNSIAWVNMTTNYTKRNCVKESNKYKVTINRIECTKISSEEPGDGNEVRGSITIQVTGEGGTHMNSGSYRPEVKASNRHMDQIFLSTIFIKDSGGNAINLKPSATGQDNSFVINEAAIYNIPEDAKDVKFKLTITLEEIDDFSANDDFKEIVVIKKGSKSKEDGAIDGKEASVTLHNTGDEFKIYYTIAPVYD
ncbi:MAG: thiol-activated cytolysin family protein [Bacteroidota bacterium]